MNSTVTQQPPSAPQQDLRDKLAIVTGASRGILVAMFHEQDQL